MITWFSMCECVCGTNSRELYWLHILTFFQIKLFKSTLVSPLINLQCRLIIPTQGINMLSRLSNFGENQNSEDNFEPKYVNKMHKLFHYHWVFSWWRKPTAFPVFYFSFKTSSTFINSSPVSMCHILLFFTSLKAFFLSVGYRCTYLFFFTRLFSASQSKCHSVSTPEENVANRVLKCYFIYSMDTDFFNITCKSNQKKRYSATECLFALLLHIPDWTETRSRNVLKPALIPLIQISIFFSNDGNMQRHEKWRQKHIRDVSFIK